ncbi:competence protein CoiA family protein [Shewanella fidelis]|uniref:Competence protein CoiA family protein n=1 Tax=Shewanella fidelis TaxID=173509 RepID=A0AAW8NJK7_9GAMM|nr:competence protein CoiA family protein [Shewanella fidelis]MDR8523469.1 competence protein CoiA family protein [Shewanella fidelis]MDW4813298.1 competence protein CoiA family protein [Shewanella fidelis]MDW4817330.1 competence protein CoiA family protein [Shewanella fidelis]MDW4821314.1 competence protein CoiA family protein [Shewanella fidelis]MDW4824608.1 competence protein CoiA family protein [Shewanella fidelis]
MPFVGKDVNSGARINILHLKDPRKELLKGQVVCPFCEAVFAIRGQVEGKLTIHFMHTTDECASSYISHPESIEHLYFKEYIARNLQSELNEYSDAKVELEYPIESMKRIIDVAFIFPNGWIVAHEVQLSEISTQELAARTKDYRNEGIDVIWWLGKGADTASNRNWCYTNQGECYTIDFETLTQISNTPQ